TVVLLLAVRTVHGPRAAMESAGEATRRRNRRGCRSVIGSSSTARRRQTVHLARGHFLGHAVRIESTIDQRRERPARAPELWPPKMRIWVERVNGRPFSL